MNQWIWCTAILKISRFVSIYLQIFKSIVWRLQSIHGWSCDQQSQMFFSLGSVRESMLFGSQTSSHRFQNMPLKRGTKISLCQLSHAGGWAYGKRAQLLQKKKKKKPKREEQESLHWNSSWHLVLQKLCLRKLQRDISELISAEQTPKVKKHHLNSRLN